MDGWYGILHIPIKMKARQETLIRNPTIEGLCSIRLVLASPVQMWLEASYRSGVQRAAS